MEAPPPGIVIYRFEESFLYPNASYINDRLIGHIKQQTRRGKDYSNISAGDRPWNDPGPKQKDAVAVHEAEKSKPRLRAVILDFSAVANLDTTGVQNLIDTRKECEKWADRPVEFHFCGILSPWIRRALIAGGFGIGERQLQKNFEVAPVVRYDDDANPADRERQRVGGLEGSRADSVASRAEKDSSSDEGSLKHPYPGREDETLRGEEHVRPPSTFLLDLSTPFFHFDLQDALNSLDLSKGRD